jgi:hypothetical protein
MIRIILSSSFFNFYLATCDSSSEGEGERSPQSLNELFLICPMNCRTSATRRKWRFFTKCIALTIAFEFRPPRSQPEVIQTRAALPSTHSRTFVIEYRTDDVIDCAVYEVRRRKDHRGVALISDVLRFGRPVVRREGCNQQCSRLRKVFQPFTMTR